MKYLIFPMGMKIKDAVAQAEPHLTTENIVFVNSPTSTVIFPITRFPARRPRTWLKDTKLARVDETGKVEIIHRLHA